MTYPTREHEELLRRALRGAADSVEPAEDGLERIRARLRPPRPALAAWMMSGAEPAALRLQPVLDWFRLRMARVPEGSRRWLVPGGLPPALRGIGPAMARLGGGAGQASPRAGWLRAAAAMAAFAVIIGSGAFAITELQHTTTSAGLTAGAAGAARTDRSRDGGRVDTKTQQPLSLYPLVVPPVSNSPRVWLMHTPAPSPTRPDRRAASSPTPSCGQPSPTPSSSPPPSSPSPTLSSPSPTTTSPSPSPTTTTPTPTPSSSVTTRGQLGAQHGGRGQQCERRRADHIGHPGPAHSYAGHAALLAAPGTRLCRLLGAQAGQRQSRHRPLALSRNAAATAPADDVRSTVGAKADGHARRLRPARWPRPG